MRTSVLGAGFVAATRLVGWALVIALTVPAVARLWKIGVIISYAVSSRSGRTLEEFAEQISGRRSMSGYAMLTPDFISAIWPSILLIVLAALGWFLAFNPRRAAAVFVQDLRRCARCGHDLSDAPNRCSECGMRLR